MERYKTIFQARGKWYTLTATVRRSTDGAPHFLKVTIDPDRNGGKEIVPYFAAPDQDIKTAIIDAWSAIYREEVCALIDQRWSPTTPEQIEIPAGLAANFRKF